MAFVAALQLAGAVFAAPPERVRLELAKLDKSPWTFKVSGLPRPLRRSLGRAFRDSELDLASAGEPVREYEFVIVGNPVFEADARRPSRRLIFAFETSSFYVVYYEIHTPVSGAALVFSKVKNPQLLWGGIDFNEPWANSPQALAHRILRNRLDDRFHPLW